LGKARNTTGVNAQPDDLFISLAEQVKLPFVQISHAAELLEGSSDASKIEASRQTISIASQAALRLIDGYLLSVELQRAGQLALEPVSISSVLYDTAQVLHEYARAHGCKLELEVSGKYAPVMAHRRAVSAALTSLGYSFIEAAVREDNQEEPVVKLAVRRIGANINTGVFSSNANLSNNLFKLAKQLRGKVHQPMAAFDSGNSTGVFIADALFTQLNTSMRVAHLHGLQGLAASLLPSRQLSLV
jgi:light-regulated signal transduction histidine kinase (bacteriophytochrome)